MKVLKIILAILIPVAVVAGLLPMIYPLVSPIEGSEFDFGEFIKKFFELFKDFSTAMDLYGFPLVIMLVAPIVGAALLVLWIVFGAIKKRLIGILFGFIAVIVLTFGALGVFLNVSFDITQKSLGLEENGGYAIMPYIELVAILLFIGAFVVHVLIMFKAAKARKEAKKAAKAAQASRGAFDPDFEVDYDDLPPCLFEETPKYREPEIIKNKVTHVTRGENHVLKGHYVRDDEIDIILAASNYRYEEEIPENILALLDEKHKAEEQGETLPMFDPNFAPSKDDEVLYTDEELRIIEALRNHRLGVEEAQEEPVQLAIFDPEFVPQAEEAPAELSEEELRIVDAMSKLESEEDEFVDLPFFRKHEEEPVEFVEEVIRVEEPEEAPEEEIDAPKLADAKPVHVSKNKEGKFQLKQVGAKKPFAEFDSEEEAIKFAEAVKKVNGISVRIHDEEGKIRSL